MGHRGRVRVRGITLPCEGLPEQLNRLSARGGEHGGSRAAGGLEGRRGWPARQGCVHVQKPCTSLQAAGGGGGRGGGGGGGEARHGMASPPCPPPPTPTASPPNSRRTQPRALRMCVSCPTSPPPPPRMRP